MKPTNRKWIAAICVIFVCGALAGQSQTQPENSWQSRLEALRPSDPMAYFNLAEDVMDRAASDADRALARHLFALAGALDPAALGQSACLALAGMETDSQSRVRLEALGALLDHDRFSSLPQPARPENSEQSVSALVAATEALSRYRQGHGALALTAAKKPGAMELLEAGSAALPGGLQRFLEDCKLYRGQLKPTLTNEDINSMLRLEIAWLGGEDRSWSSELFLTGGAPLIEVDPHRLGESFGIDASRSVYRRGAWVRP